MDGQAWLTIFLVTVMSFLVAMVVTFITKKIHRNLVFVWPGLLTLFTGYLALYVFNDDAGWGAVFLVGFMVIAGIASLVSWCVALYSYFRQHDASKDNQT